MTRPAKDKKEKNQMTITIESEPGRRCRCRGVAIDRSANQRLEFGLANVASAGASEKFGRKFRSVRAARDAIVNPVTERSVIEFDPLEANVGEVLEACRALGVKIQPTGMRWYLQLKDAACSDCIRVALRAAMQVIGVEGVIYDRRADRLTVDFAASLTDPNAISGAIEAAHCNKRYESQG